MNRTIDFHGILSLDFSLAEQLSSYLVEKESNLAQKIIHANPLVEPSPPRPSSSTIFHLKLSESVEIFDKKISQLVLNEKTAVFSNNWTAVKEELDQALWEYTEVLEECSIEFYQQLTQIPLDKWKFEVLNTIKEIKIILIHRMEELIWAFRRLDHLFWKYRKICEVDYKRLAINLLFLDWKSLLDKQILVNLKNSQKFLSFHYKNFVDRYDQFRSLYNKSEQNLQRFQSYAIFHLLERDSQEKFKKCYQLLKLWEFNSRSKSFPNEEIVHTIRVACSTEHLIRIFKEYLKLLTKEVFFRSRLLKVTISQKANTEIDQLLGLEVIKGFRSETHMLAAMISLYREFLWRTDPDPYVRTRWRFMDWGVGSEPVQVKALLNLNYEADNLDQLFQRIYEAIERGPQDMEGLGLVLYKQEIQSWLHEMKQPLASKQMMHRYAERVLKSLDELNELGSFNPHVIEFVGRKLANAMRVDWKYHVLFEIPLFQKIYHIHQGVAGVSEDRQHLNRLNHFKRLIQQLEGWLKSKTVHRHTHEIEHEVNDMKGYLQDFFGYIQRTLNQTDVDLLKMEQSVKEINQQLLEYRYIFGKFFHDLRQNEPEEKSIRNQFLFVDQYFESMENLIYDKHGFAHC